VLGSGLQLLNSYAAAKKVSAAPHRGEANRPIRIQGKANAVGKQPKTNLTRPIRIQGKANAVGKQSKTNLTRPIRIQGKANAVGKQPKTNLTRPIKMQEKANTVRATTKAPQAKQPNPRATSPHPNKH
jgi:predicted lipoprotein